MAGEGCSGFPNGTLGNEGKQFSGGEVSGGSGVYDKLRLVKKTGELM